MLWREGRRSSNIEDIRGSGGGFGGGGFGGLPIGPGIGGGGAIVLLLVAWAFGINPGQILGPDTGGPAPSSYSSGGPDQDADLKDFVSAVLADTEDTWTAVFKEMGKTYEDPTLVLYSGEVNSACGFAQAAVGPFYCPGDHKVYLDLSFFSELKDQLGAPGEFAQAYVIAHEIGHHVQTLLGTMDQVDRQRQSLSKTRANALSVRTELQADCYAGVWANRTDKMQHILEAGDIDSALGAAAAVGDDRLQREETGRVMPDSFTHGTSEQRDRWFKRGFTGGKISDCDTFGASTL